MKIGIDPDLTNKIVQHKARVKRGGIVMRTKAQLQTECHRHDLMKKVHGDCLYEDRLIDELHGCVSHIASFFRILVKADFGGVASDIAFTGQDLVEDVYRQVDRLCDFIERELGDVKIVREKPEYYGPWKGDMVGVNFTPVEQAGTDKEKKVATG